MKSALHRGRTRLHELAKEPEDAPPPVLSQSERTLLAAYIERFNAKNYDAVRAMLADEVRLGPGESGAALNGKADVQRYFTNYAKATPRSAEPGLRRWPPGDAGIRRRCTGGPRLLHPTRV